jgi:hypothetical protein
MQRLAVSALGAAKETVCVRAVITKITTMMLVLYNFEVPLKIFRDTGFVAVITAPTRGAITKTVAQAIVSKISQPKRKRYPLNHPTT